MIRRLGDTLSLLTMLFPLAGLASPAEPLHAEVSVEKYRKADQTVGCGLVFLATWKGPDASDLGSSGTLNVFVARDGTLTTGVKVVAMLHNQPLQAKLAWVEVRGMPSTREFSPMSPPPQPPYAIFLEWEDKFGKPRLEAAARAGFELKLSLAGRPDNEVVRIPPAPSSKVSELRECLQLLQVR